MAGKVKAVPEGTHTITPHLSVREAAKAIEFYKKAFGAEVKGVHYAPDGKVMHAMLKIGDSNLMMADEFPGMGTPAPQTLGGSPVVLNIYVENVDALFNQAVAAGAQVTMPLRTSSGATATARSKIPSAIAGRWGSTSRMWPPRRWSAAARRSSPIWRRAKGRAHKKQWLVGAGSVFGIPGKDTKSGFRNPNLVSGGHLRLPGSSLQCRGVGSPGWRQGGEE